MIPKRHRSHFARRQKRKRTQNPGPRPPDSTAARAATRNFGADWKNRGSGARNRTASGLSRSVSVAKSRLPVKKPDASSRRTTAAGQKRNIGDGRQNKVHARPSIRILLCAAMRAGASSGEGNKALSALSYLSILFALPYIFTPNDEFAKFHAKQGLKLFVFGIVADMLAAFVGLGWIVTLIRLYLIYKGMTNALNGRKEKLPWIGNILE